MKNNFSLSLKNLGVIVFGLISITIVFSGFLEFYLVDKINKKTNSLMSNVHNLLDHSKEMKYIVADIQRITSNSILLQDQEILMLAPIQSIKFYKLLDKLKLSFEHSEPEIKEHLEELKKQYKNFVTQVLSMSAQFVEGMPTSQEHLIKVNKTSQNFIENLNGLTNRVEKISEKKLTEIESLNQYTFAINIFSTITILLTVVFAIVVTKNNLTNPINRLIQFVRENTGERLNPSNRVNISAKNEIGEFADGLNSMLNQLDETSVSRDLLLNEVEERSLLQEQLMLAKDELEIRVQERTIELENTNKNLEIEIYERIKFENELHKSEKQYRSLIETSTDGIIVADHKGDIIKWNKAAENIFDYEKKEVIGKPVSRIIPDRFRSAHEKGYINFIKTGQKRLIGKTIEIEGKKKNGSIVPIELSISAAKTENETLITTIIRDISKRKIVEKQLLHSHDTQKVINSILKKSIAESSIEEIFNESLDVILSIPWLSFESTGAILIADRKLKKLVLKAQKGYSEKQLNHCSSIKFGDCYCGQSAQSGEVILHPLCEEKDHKILGRHGHYCIPIMDGNHPLGVICLFIKEGYERHGEEEIFLKIVAQTLSKIILRENAENEKNIIESQLQQTQKMESIGNLAGGIAHDFNNILSSIIGFTELALGGVAKGSEIEDDLLEVKKGGLRAKDLVGQILTFARQSDEKIKPIQVGKIAEEVLKFIKSSIPSTIQIKENINSESFIMGSATRVHQVLMNLCTNAAHAMEDQGGLMVVSIKDLFIEGIKHDEDMPKGDCIQIRISDTGLGISPNIMDKIFDPYFTTKKQGKGTGMGLAVVHGIVQTYGGKIIVESENKKGTIFTIWLPISKKCKNNKPTEIEERPTGKENLLFIDDEPTITKMGRKLLEQLGYSVTTSNDSIEALELFRSNPNHFDLVVTDMTMPKMNGDVLAMELIKIKKDIKIVLCTGYSNKITQEIAHEIGIKAFVYKPVEQVPFSKTIRNILNN